MKRKIKRSMKRKMLNSSLVAVLALTTIPLNIFPSAAKAESTGTNTATLRILETTDLHSNVMPYDYFKDAAVKDYGLAKTATLIQQARSEVSNSMLFDAGDTIQGNPLASYVAKVNKLGPNDTHPIFKAMNYLKYDAGIVGNHEFNYGLDYLKDVMEEVQFPIVNANIYHDDKDGNPDNDKNYFTPFKIIDKTIKDNSGKESTIKVGVIGFAPPQIMKWDKDNLTGKVIAKDIKKQAEKFIPEMKAAGADVIVAIAHSGCDIAEEGQEEAENAVYDLTKVPGIDAMLFGHAHLKFPEDASFKDKNGIDVAKGTINGVQAIEAGFWGNNLGVLDLALVKDEKGKWTVDKSNSKSVNRAVTADTPTDEKIVADVKGVHDGTLNYVRGKIGETDIPMHSFFTRVMDDASTQIVNAAQMDYVKSWIKTNAPEYKDVPVLSAAAPFKGGRGGVADYTNIAKGDVTIKSAADLYLFDNTLKALEVTGDQVKRWIEKSAEQFNTIDPNKEGNQELLNYDFRPYNYDVVDGVKYQIDVTKPVGERVINLTMMDGTPVKADQKFIIATNNYRAGGSGGLAELKNSKVVVDSPFENRQILMDYISSKGTINPVADNNWKIAPVGGVAKLVFHSAPEALPYLDQQPNVKDLGTSSTKAGYELFELDQNVHVQLLGINDYHGQLDTWRDIKDKDGKVVDHSGGIEYLAGYLKEREATNPSNTLMLAAGDQVGASAPVSALLQDEPTIRFMNEIGFDAATIGNHEFDEGVPEMLRLINGGSHPATVDKYGAFEGADFPVVAANVEYEDTGKLILDPYVIKEVDGVKIGIIGVVTTLTPEIVIKSAVKNVKFTDEVTAINKYTKELEAKGVKSIVVLAHNPGSSKTDGTGAAGEVVEFAKKVDPQVDVIYGAHDHKYLRSVVNGITVVQSWSYGTAFSDIDLTIDPLTGDVIKDQTKAEVVDTLHSKIQPDAKIQAELKEYKDAIAPILNRKIGETEVELTRTPNASGEQVLGNIIADSMRWQMDTQMGFMNPGGIRNDINAGEITWGELFNVQPFGNDLIKMTVTGDVLKELLNQQWADPTRAKMLQISGLYYTYDDSKPYMSRILDIYEEDGTPIKKDSKYTITVNNFMAGGGDGYGALLKGTDKVQGPTDLDALVNYIQNYDGAINAGYENRFLKADKEIAETSVYYLSDLTTVLEGETDPYATVVAKVKGKVIGEGKADNYGYFSIDIPKQASGTTVVVETTDLFGNYTSAEFIVEEALKGWQQLDGEKDWYYFNPETGEPVTEWFNIKGKWYFFDEEGVMQTGWYQENGKWYYLDKVNGDMKVNWYNVNGKWYYFNKSGAMQTGWYQENGKWYFLDKANGDMKVNWVNVNGKWYFFNKSGAMLTGWVKDGNTWYYLTNSGAMQTGWVKVNNKWYFLKSSGAMQTGWVQVGSKWYFLYNDGSMAANTSIGKYKVGKDGAWIN
ncbi:bifunctional 2',3'-cyclic-nucleotide 2'-phosphodiesterase/3'-nucleotidase [Bacillus sp. S3]|uniref:bifunctional 2',3'-cyclic-nucleotide 2'-phosphodiesterase/3'-nucleotidase n=1 Tax=Bacillus sp. S3 TaxID=486398 RepID=UPI00118C96BA|nr:bifunctional 2',3'-cyclic-nucleotide 2'-phosphodiesterase/3'-nucleotidase [Bacillus sp. S3]QCJ44131.1 bifunctional 2',3'-cyclic-nucleotide 2'-phosphodiesterase/3'-nucleotidase [Bacillus sp. S3]